MQLKCLLLLEWKSINSSHQFSVFYVSIVHIYSQFTFTLAIDVIFYMQVLQKFEFKILLPPGNNMHDLKRCIPVA